MPHKPAVSWSNLCQGTLNICCNSGFNHTSPPPNLKVIENIKNYNVPTLHTTKKHESFVNPPLASFCVDHIL